MPRCCVSGCNSGTFSDVKQLLVAGRRSKSFFSFPKEKDLLNEWKKIIFHDAAKIVNNLKICELHFKEADIIKYDETILKDGTVHRIQRERCALNGQAIPIISNEKEKGTDEQEISDNPRTESIKIIICQDQLSDIHQEKKNKVPNQEIDFSLTHSKAIKRTYSVPKKKINTQMHTCIDIDNCERKECKTISNKEINCKINSKICINNLCEDNTSNKNGQNNKSIENYAFSQLKKDLQTKNLAISSSWAYIFQENTSVIFVYIHPLKLTIQLFCIIDCNMNVKIATFDRKINKDVNIKINTNGDLTNFLFELEKAKCCDGTGIDNKFSNTCQGFISSKEEYKRSRGYHRCNSCREYRKIILKKEDNMINIELRMREQNRKIQALQFKYAQLRKLLLKKS